MITEELLQQYYESATIHLAWLVRPNGTGKPVTSTRHLVFCMIEAYPKELTVFPVLKEQCKKFKSGRLYYVRIKRTIDQALKLYKDVKDHGLIAYDWDNGFLETPVPSSKEISCGIPETLEYVRPYMCFTLSDRQQVNTPFIAGAWGKANIHQIMAADQDPYLLEFLHHEKPGEWLEQFLGWNISCYPELTGSVQFVLPNPFYSSCSICMVPGSGNTDRIKLDFQPRKGISLEELSVVPFEKTYFGLSLADEVRLTKPTCMIELQGRAENFGMYVRHPNFGLIEQKGFAGFFRGYDIELYIKNATKRIHRPKSGRVDEVGEYQLATSVRNIDVEAVDEDGLGKRLDDAEIRRYRLMDANRQGLNFFYQDHDSAERFVRSLIRRARRKIRIIDPYFSANEQLNYVADVFSPDVKVEVIASAECLKQKSKSDDHKNQDQCTLGEELFRQYKNWKKKKIAKLTINVLTGDHPAIHDRFVFVDDETWFSGNSLNELGARLSCIVKLADSTELEEMLKEIRDDHRIIPLEKWLEGRRGSIGTDKSAETREEHGDEI